MDLKVAIARVWERVRQLAKQPTRTLRYTSVTLWQQLKRLLNEGVDLVLL
ncbi:hypothetical protein [Lyngbya aestuarii]